MNLISKKVIWVILVVSTGLGILLPDVGYQAFLFAILSAFLLVCRIEKEDGIKKRWFTLFGVSILSLILCCGAILLHNLMVSQPFMMDQLLFGALICISFCLIINVLFLIFLDFMKKTIIYGILAAGFLYIFIIANVFQSLMKIINSTLSTATYEVRYIIPWDLFAIALVIFIIGSAVAMALHQYRMKHSF